MRKSALQSEGEGRQTATLLLWTPRTALFPTVKDSSKEIYMCRTTSEFHYTGKKRKISSLRSKVGLTVCM